MGLDMLHERIRRETQSPQVFYSSAIEVSEHILAYKTEFQSTSGPLTRLYDTYPIHQVIRYRYSYDLRDYGTC